MHLGVAVRSMGPQSQPDVLLACVRAAEQAGLADVWVQDHIAIPPDDAEGSGGRYLDPLTALAWLAGQVPRIGLGTGVLILPYRPALPTAKAIATLQELSAGRLRLGVGVGWMEAEFRALGVPRARARAPDRRDAGVPARLLHRRRGARARPGLPVPAAAVAPADLRGRRGRARAPARDPLRRRLDADDRRSRAARAGRRAIARARGRGRARACPR